jgi:hypothetical protein
MHVSTGLARGLRPLLGQGQLEVDGSRCAIIGTRPVNHRRIAPGAAIIGEYLTIEIRDTGRASTHKTGLVEEVGIVADQPFGEGLRLGEEIPMPVGAGYLAVGIHKHRVGWYHVHHGKADDSVRMIERKPVSGAAAAIMPDHVKPVEAERAQENCCPDFSRGLRRPASARSRRWLCQAPGLFIFESMRAPLWVLMSRIETTDDATTATIC